MKERLLKGKDGQQSRSHFGFDIMELSSLRDQAGVYLPDLYHMLISVQVHINFQDFLIFLKSSMCPFSVTLSGLI